MLKLFVAGIKKGNGGALVGPFLLHLTALNKRKKLVKAKSDSIF